MEDLVSYFAGKVGDSLCRGFNPANAYLVIIEGELSNDTPYEKDEGECLCFPREIVFCKGLQETSFVKDLEAYLCSEGERLRYMGSCDWVIEERCEDCEGRGFYKEKFEETGEIEEHSCLSCNDGWLVT